MTALPADEHPRPSKQRLPDEYGLGAAALRRWDGLLARCRTEDDFRALERKLDGLPYCRARLDLVDRMAAVWRRENLGAPYTREAWANRAPQPRPTPSLATGEVWNDTLPVRVELATGRRFVVIQHGWEIGCDAADRLRFLGAGE
jgi:hypothetical protein